MNDDGEEVNAQTMKIHFGTTNDLRGYTFTVLHCLASALHGTYCLYDSYSYFEETVGILRMR
jgi:hypothetical protein